MEEFIYKIISNYINRDEPITKSGLDSILYIYREMRGLYNYISALRFTDDSTTTAYYGNRIIEYNYNKILENYEDEELYASVFLLVQSLFHEITHAEHKKLLHLLKDESYREHLYKNPYDKAYSMIVEDSFYYFDLDYKNASNEELRIFKDNEEANLELKFRSLYKKNHDLFPDERICDIEAIKYLKQLVYKYEKDEVKLKRYIDFLDSYYYFYLIKDYELNIEDGVISPVEKYIRRLSFEDHRDEYIELRKQILRNRPHDIQSIMTLGLRIDYKTYSNMFNYTCYVNDCEENKGKVL